MSKEKDQDQSLETPLEKMNLKHVQISKEEIEKELTELQEAINKGFVSPKNKMVQDLLRVMGHFKHNGKVIDIYDSFRQTGIDENMDPKLAIARADSQGGPCYLYKYNNGSGLFSIAKKRSYGVTPNKADGDTKTPTDMFRWSSEDLDSENRYRKCAVPLIPPRISLAVSCRIVPQHYYIIFEPREWVKYRAKPRAPQDPILCRKLTNNLFGVLAHWDMTPLEMKIIEGNL